MKLPQSQLETPFTDRSLRVRFLGSKIPYLEGMTQMRIAMANVERNSDEGDFELILLEHSNTITTTRLHGTRSFKKTVEEIEANGIQVVETDRGGDVTFHGEGQLVGYLVVRLADFDLGAYLRKLERALLNSVRSFGLKNIETIPGKTGIWVVHDHMPPKKLIAIGVGVSKGITKHGFAMNITTQLEKFTDCIVPCGLEGLGVTSLERENPTRHCLKSICETISREISSSLGLKPKYEVGFDPRLSVN